MIKASVFERMMLPALTAVFPFAIIAGQLGLDLCRWWMVYDIAASVAIVTGIVTFGMRKTAGPMLTVSYPWAIYWVGLAALTTLQGFFYAELRNQCPVSGPIIPIDMLLEWLIAPPVLTVVAASAFRYTRTATARRMTREHKDTDADRRQRGRRGTTCG